MAGVRGRKTRRSKRMNSTSMGIKRKKKAKLKLITHPTLKKKWDEKKTLQQNMKEFGLASDPNKVVKSGYDMGDVDDTEMLAVNKTEVIEEFEQEAKNGKKTERLIAAGEAKFLLQMMKDHGDNYKAMAWDKRNYYQHTPKQLRRKCEKFLASPYYSKYAQDEQIMEVE